MFMTIFLPSTCFYIYFFFAVIITILLLSTIFEGPQPRNSRLLTTQAFPNKNARVEKTHIVLLFYICSVPPTFIWTFSFSMIISLSLYIHTSLFVACTLFVSNPFMTFNETKNLFRTDQTRDHIRFFFYRWLAGLCCYCFYSFCTRSWPVFGDAVVDIWCLFLLFFPFSVSLPFVHET